MNIKIDKLEDTTFSIGQIVDLLHESFQERLDAGLNLQGAFVDEKEINGLLQNGMALVAYDCDNVDLLGVTIITFHNLSKGRLFC